MKNKSDAHGCLVDAIVRLSHCSAKWGKVWGLGIAASVAGGSLATDDWKWVARTVEWKIYLGPLMLSGWFPYHIQRGKEPTYSCKPNTAIECKGSSAQHVNQ